jgi:arylformamidase
MGAWIDISVPVQVGMHHWPGEPPVIERHEWIAKGSVCNVTRMRISAHTGTHMDAPLHFVDGAASMEQLPLDAVMGPCVVVEVDDPEAVRAGHLEGLDLGERVLFKTRNSAECWQKPGFDEGYVYIADDAAKELVRRGVRTVGIDYLSVGGFRKDLVETHVTLLGAGIWVIEGLDLSGVAAGRYELACLPLKMVGSDGAPARAALRPL